MSGAHVRRGASEVAPQLGATIVADSVFGVLSMTRVRAPPRPSHRAFSLTFVVVVRRLVISSSR